MPIEVEAPHTVEQKLKAADAAEVQIEKDHGKGAIFNLGSKVGSDWPSIPTGILSLDYNVLKIGGIPRNRITEIYGPEAGGKTTLTLHVIAEAQRNGELCAIVDAEHALDPNWATTLGVDVSKLRVSQPDNGEQALEIAETLVRSQAFGVIVVDSVAALVPRSELEGDMGDSNMGVQARLMSQACRKLTGAVAKSGSALIFINQIRDKIGVMFGSPETTTGGRALKFYASLRLDIRRIAAVKDGEKVIGNRVRIKAVKNKLAAPFKETETDLLFDRGFDRLGNLIDVAVEQGLIQKSGSWYNYGTVKLGQGKESVMTGLAANTETLDKIEAQVKDKLRGK